MRRTLVLVALVAAMSPSAAAQDIWVSILEPGEGDLVIGEVWMDEGLWP